MSVLDDNSSNDPFTLILGGLWDMMENSVPLTDCIAAGNRIKFLGKNSQEPIKDQRTDTDNAELTITPAVPFSGGPDPLTSEDLWTWRWDVTVATGRYELDQLGYTKLFYSLFPCLWAVYRTLMGYGQNLKLIKLNGIYLVHDVRPGNIEITKDDQSKLHGLKGWAGTWPFYTGLRIDTLGNAAGLVS